ncbi:MAG: hydantoinase B/oxoprolinase family protein [Syntrophales bacterium]|nr:hydantoinase B/oxoprolinase family protein [Syntrophales bacterium]MCK9528686.1 hydantoinase B/oxoprolinase family protein [Syntrophales bacterium]MDX9922639.1 hydantoinase B/oxoprolinase family protein [Syntrophales bacterium]
MKLLKLYDISLLNLRFGLIPPTMDQVLHKTARSSQLNVGKDYSSGVTLGDGGEFIVEEGDPTHLAALHLVPEAVFKLVGEENIKPGDCYLTNSAHAGGTHHADYTLAVPVFYDNELMFWAINRAHQSDLGAPLPTSYPAKAKNIYEEGLHYPIMQIQSGYEDRKDLIRMIMYRNRVPDRYYGDYLGQLSAVRTAERELIAICDEYGVEKVKEYISWILNYSDRLMADEIGKLPKMENEITIKHDPIWDVAPDGVEVKAKVIVNPKEKTVTVDFTGNKTKNLPFGFNVSEATLSAAAYWGVFSNLKQIPHNAGSYKHIKIKMNDGTVIGRPSREASTAIATTNIVGRAFSAVSMAFVEMGKPYGFAEGANGMLANWAVISGKNPRKEGEKYAAQIFLGAGGGPGLFGYDGWLTFGTPDSGGAMRCDSVELFERNYPILVDRVAVRKDSLGAGEFDGAPGVDVAFGPVDTEITIGYYGDCIVNPPRGVLGGKDAAKSEIFKIDVSGKRIDLDIIKDNEVIKNGEKVVSLTSGGGGYGSPKDRDPNAVIKKVKQGWISAEFARNNYNVSAS